MQMYCNRGQVEKENKGKVQNRKEQLHHRQTLPVIKTHVTRSGQILTPKLYIGQRHYFQSAIPNLYTLVLTKFFKNSQIVAFIDITTLNHDMNKLWLIVPFVQFHSYFHFTCENCFYICLSTIYRTEWNTVI